MWRRDCYQSPCIDWVQDVVGIDASQKNIDIAKFHAKKNKLKINYICASPETLKIKKKFDVILNMEIVEHVEDVNFFIKKSSRIVKKKWFNVYSNFKQNFKIIYICNCRR